MDKLIYKDKTYAIRGAVFEVYKEMGNGYLEAVYQECLAREFAANDIPSMAQTALVLQYKGQTLEQIYRADFVCYGKIIVEIKAVKTLANEHKAQLLNYLKSTGMKLGLLINFGSPEKVQIERLIL
ncbi:MAG: GxxExxY protein [Gammaproteobacteria bacterium]|nr:GxxExxY protein [Gammaproteobacteria bacterium]